MRLLKSLFWGDGFASSFGCHCWLFWSNAGTSSVFFYILVVACLLCFFGPVSSQFFFVSCPAKTYLNCLGSFADFAGEVCLW